MLHLAVQGAAEYDTRHCFVTTEGRGESEKRLKDTGTTVLCKMRFFVYTAVLDEEAQDVVVKLSSDLVRYQWTALAKLKDRKLTPPSIALFTRLGYL
jgi:hypothetical protein